MKIVSWNCNCKFREKYKKALELDAEIYVIQEAENPAKYGDQEYRDLLKNGFWMGDIQFKGLLIFSTREDIKLERLNWEDGDKRYFMPVRVNDAFTLVGVWACDPYIEEFYDYKEIIADKLGDDVIFIGDFNSNKQFDKEHKRVGKTHSIVVEQLQEVGIEDIYHHLTGDKQGHEKVPTFFLYRHLDKPFHIDHCFSNPKNVTSFKVEASYKWIVKSDHLPLVIETAI